MSNHRTTKRHAAECAAAIRKHRLERRYGPSPLARAIPIMRRATDVLEAFTRSLGIPATFTNGARPNFGSGRIDPLRSKRKG